jgi:hypothetical protein
MEQLQSKTDDLTSQDKEFWEIANAILEESRLKEFNLEREI